MAYRTRLTIADRVDWQTRSTGRQVIRHSLIVGQFLLAWIVAWPVSRLAADELTLNATQLFERGVNQHLHLPSNGTAIELQRGVLVEDDGPAAGYSYQANVERLAPGVWIRKQLIVSSPQTRRATLLVGGRGDWSARINGRLVELDSIGKQGNYWQAYRLPPKTLRQNVNEIVLSGSGSVWIARDDEYAAGSLTRTRHPNRSAKSLDAGKTWNDSALGTNSDIDGEYYVRLFLDQHRPHGKLTLSVIDAGNLAEQPIGPPVTSVGPILVRADVASGPGRSLRLRQRTGTTFVPNEHDWSKWSTVELSDGRIDKPIGRYLQLELGFQTDDPLQTPALASLSISASPRRPADWTKAVRIVKFDNRPITRSSIPFQYEPFNRPELARLRRDYKLDDVVAGTSSEFELIQRLAAWSATRWQRMHLQKSYPSYNALKILAAHEDGTPVGGFCQQFNIVFLQACESFGLVGRLVSIGPGNRLDLIRSGHETAEIWSNEFRKWIYIDGNTAWYAVDKETATPLSLLELRERQLATFRDQPCRAIRVVKLASTKYDWPNLASWPPFAELRLIPRSNFLEQRAPLPLNQGMRGWFWTGHHVWTGDRVGTGDTEPARMLYSNRIERRADFEWTVNRAHLTFEATQPGILRTHIDTETPGLQQFLREGETRTTPARAVFEWRLESGGNRIRVVPRNIAGRTGVPATVELTWGR